ncbi:MAG: hypothetical protein AB8G99_25525 [Planctomycetaceae bacterium]
MKHTALSIAAVCSTLLAGCNQLNSVGSQSIVFDRDPFVQLDENESTAANSATPTGRVSVGNFNNPQQAGYAAQAQQQGGAPATATYSFNGGGNSDVAAMYAPQQQPRQPHQQYGNGQPAPQPLQAMQQMTSSAQPHAASSPAARAAAETAALLARMGKQPQQIQQMSHEVATAGTPTAPSSGIVTADFSPDPFEPASNQAVQSHMMTPSGVVPMPPEAQYNPTNDQFELSEADLQIPTTQADSNPEYFPGTNIPTGKVSLDTILPSEWEPTPKPTATAATPVQTNPVFSPPTTSGAVPVTPTDARAAGPVIRDSTNHSKWRAARRR